MTPEEMLDDAPSQTDVMNDPSWEPNALDEYIEQEIDRRSAAARLAMNTVEPA